MRLVRFIDNNLIHAPHRLMPKAVFLFVLLAFCYHPQSPIHTFQLRDSDDYMRLNEVINWLGGQGWFDLSHPRLSPGAHTVLHWSRLVDLPVAALMLLFLKIPIFTMQTAAIMAALIVPAILLGLLLKLVPALAMPLAGKGRANWAAAFVLFAPMTLFNFTPGHIDHHNWQVLIAGFGLLALVETAGSEEGWVYAVMAAVAFACGLWIGTEALPWLILFIACLALTGAWQGGFALRNGAVFGGALALAVAAVLPVAVPPEDYSSRDLSWFSSADAIFAALCGYMLATGWLLGRLTEKRALRVALMLALGFFSAMLFIRLVPDVLAGPFADFDDFDSTIALGNIGEAIPLSTAFHINIYNPLSLVAGGLAFMKFLFLPFCALGAVAWNLKTSRHKLPWLFHGAFLLASTLLAIFWQARVGWFMELFAIAPLVWLAGTFWENIDRLAVAGRKGNWAKAGVFLVLGPLPVLLIPAMAGAENPWPNLILFPAAAPAENGCNLKNATDFIAGPWGYVDRTYTILAGANEGPELLFRTADNVIAGNFNVTGNRDVYDFFNARDDKTAIAILRKWHVDLVLTCRSMPPFYSGTDHPQFGKNVFLRLGPDGKLHLMGNPAHPALIERLVNGPVPSWLKPVELPTTNDYLLFEFKQKDDGQ